MNKERLEAIKDYMRKNKLNLIILKQQINVLFHSNNRENINKAWAYWGFYKELGGKGMLVKGKVVNKK